MGGFGCICLPISSHIGQSGGGVAGLPIQENHSDCYGVAQDALVLGSSDHVQSNPTELALSAQPVNTALQSDPSQKSNKPKSPCMAPRDSAIKEQGFFEAVAARIEAPQRGSTRSVYEAKWAILFYKMVHHKSDRVLTYKNLIYLLNLQFCNLGTFIMRKLPCSVACFDWDCAKTQPFFGIPAS